MNFFERIKKTLDGMLDSSYLFNEDRKRVRVNVKFLIVLLIISDLVNGIASMLAHGPSNSWFGAVIPVVLGALVFIGAEKTRSTIKTGTLVWAYILLNIWIQFIFYGALMNYQLLLIYPLAVCFFMGNSFGIKFLPVLFVNILICMWGWSKALELFSDGKPYIFFQFIVSFICSCVFAFAMEYIHSRNFTHLTSLTNQITDNSYTDPLTRLLTRRGFNERFSSQLEEQAVMGKSLFVIMCDIDHFKSVNDNYGHQTGDDVLKHVSGILSKYAVGKDLCFRWGGEEFLIFLHEKSLQKAIDATNRIRVVLEYTPFLSSTAGVIKVTMSFGLHQYDTTMSMDKNISVADGYLYAAKHNGRNRVEHA